MNNTIVDDLHTEFTEIHKFLLVNNELSWATVVENNFRKILLVAAASRFEQSMTNEVLKFTTEATSAKHPLTFLVKSKAIDRMYYTWFDWNANNANKFFKLFGENFQNHMKKKIRENEELERSISAFIEIGRSRNRMIHEDFGNFTLEKTQQEIQELYDHAKLFVEQFPIELRTFTDNN